MPKLITMVKSMNSWNFSLKHAPKSMLEVDRHDDSGDLTLMISIPLSSFLHFYDSSMNRNDRSSSNPIDSRSLAIRPGRDRGRRMRCRPRGIGMI